MAGRARLERKGNGVRSSRVAVQNDPNHADAVRVAYRVHNDDRPLSRGRPPPELARLETAAPRRA
jgi:hypothetical protein